MSMVVSYSNLAQAPMPLPVTQLVGNGTLDASATFTRLTGNASYYDATPIMQTAAANAPRWDHDPLTGAALGLLIEQQSTNHLTYSGIDGGTSNISITGSASITALAWLGAFTHGVSFPGDSTTTYALIRNYTSLANVQYSLSVFVKMGDSGTPVFINSSATSDAALDITGQVVSASSAIKLTGNISRIGGAYTHTASNTANGVIRYSSNSQRPFIVTGYQLENGAHSTSYIPTSGTAATRAEEVLTYPAPAAAGTILLDHDAAVGASLINTNSTDILTSQGAGKIAIAWDASGTAICYNGGAVTAGAAIAWGSDYRLLKNANAHIKPNGALLHLRKLSDAELQALTA